MNFRDVGCATHVNSAHHLEELSKKNIAFWNKKYYTLEQSEYVQFERLEKRYNIHLNFLEKNLGNASIQQQVTHYKNCITRFLSQFC